MATVEVRVFFRASPERVFGAIADHERFFSGSPIRSAKVTKAGSPDRNGLGAIREISGPGLDFVEEITLFDRPRAYEYRVRKINLPAVHEFGRLDFNPRDGGTEVVWQTRYQMPMAVVGPVFAWLMAPVFKITFTRLLERARAGLKA